MRLRAMAWAVGQDVGNPLRKLVLMVLADEHRDDTDLCCPGLERIAAIGEMSTKSAARHIDALAELGKITVYKRGRSHGYILHYPPKADAVSNEAPEPALATELCPILGDGVIRRRREFWFRRSGEPLAKQLRRAAFLPE